MVLNINVFVVRMGGRILHEHNAGKIICTNGGGCSLGKTEVIE